MALDPNDARMLDFVEECCGKDDAKGLCQMLACGGAPRSGAGGVQAGCALKLPAPFSGEVCYFWLAPPGEVAWRVEVFPGNKAFVRAYRFRRDGRVEADLPDEPSLLAPPAGGAGPRFSTWEAAIHDIRRELRSACDGLRRFAARWPG
jgi:hypothetical protein